MASSGVGEIFLCEGRMNAERYITMLNEVLEPSILKLFDEDVPQYYFQQDNAPCHKAKKSLDWFSTNEVPLITWPPQSPDLSPIENLWSILKRKLSIYRCKSKEEFKAKILDEWEKIPANVCKDLVDSMPKRLRAVIKAKGGATKY
jgi:transposase